MRRFISTVTVLVAILAIFPLYGRFKVAAAPVAPGVHLGGLDLSAVKEREEIRAHLERVYSEPIAVQFAGERLPLRPQDIDFRIDVDQMMAEAGQYLSGPAFMDIALREVFGFEQQRRDVPARYMLDIGKLRAWLENVALEHNRAPQPARALPPDMRWRAASAAVEGAPGGYVGLAARDWVWTPGTPGYTLDVEESIAEVVRALASSDDRTAELALIETPVAPPSMADLEKMIDSYLSSFPGFAAVYVYDIRHDEAANVDADVAFSGMSTLKIAIVSALMHKLEGLPADDRQAYQVGQWMDYALGESNNYAANMLLGVLGDGDASAGARYVTDFMRGLGFENTYMQSAYDFAAQLAEIPTPGNTRTDWDTNPDHNLQSTPAEMGELLAALYECVEGRGLLLERYPQEITPEECEWVLFYMGHDEFQELVWGGLPKIDESWIVHKHGFAYESHSDVALIWGPTGPYVVSVFLFRRGWMDWDTSNGTMKAVSRMVWNFFEFQQEQRGGEPGAPLELKPPPAYAPIGAFIPAD